MAKNTYFINENKRKSNSLIWVLYKQFDESMQFPYPTDPFKLSEVQNPINNFCLVHEERCAQTDCKATIML